MPINLGNIRDQNKKSLQGYMDKNMLIEGDIWEEKELLKIMEIAQNQILKIVNKVIK